MLLRSVWAPPGFSELEGAILHSWPIGSPLSASIRNCGDVSRPLAVAGLLPRHSVLRARIRRRIRALKDQVTRTSLITILCARSLPTENLSRPPVMLGGLVRLGW